MDEWTLEIRADSERRHLPNSGIRAKEQEWVRCLVTSPSLPADYGRLRCETVLGDGGVGQKCEMPARLLFRRASTRASGLEAHPCHVNCSRHGGSSLAGQRCASNIKLEERSAVNNAVVLPAP